MHVIFVKNNSSKQNIMNDLIEWLQKIWSASDNDEAVKVASLIKIGNIKMPNIEHQSTVTAVKFIEM